jgi:hypothetical protein
MPWKRIEDQNIASRIFNTTVGISLFSFMLRLIYSGTEPGYRFAYEVPTASKEVCCKAVKLALFVRLHSLHVCVCLMV